MLRQLIRRSTGKETAHVIWTGIARMSPNDVRRLTKREMFGLRSSSWERTVRKHWDIRTDPGKGEIHFFAKPNLVVPAGVQRSLDKLFGITGTPTIPAGNVVRMGVDNGTTNPVATGGGSPAGSRSSDQGGGADTGSSSQTLRTFDATPTRSANVVTSLGTFNDTTTAGIGAVGFIMKRLFLSAHTANITNTTSADAQDTLYSATNVFTIDFTSIATWSIVFSATVTGAGT